MSGTTPYEAMFELVRGLPAQMRQSHASAQEILSAAALPDACPGVVVCGMGGSAAAAAVLQARAGLDHFEWRVSRAYRPPVVGDDPRWFVFSSYSGNTEETLAAYDAVVQTSPRSFRIVVGSGGQLGERARAEGVPVLEVPGGLPPRASLGHGIGVLWALYSRAHPADGRAEELAAAIDTAERRLSALHGDDGLEALAQRWSGGLPLLWAGSDLTHAVAQRIRAQLNENSKCLAHTAVLPELDHNEVVGFLAAPEVAGRAHVLALRDSGEHPRVGLRFEVTREIVATHAASWTEWALAGRIPLARALDGIVRGDWLSVHLARAHGVDPFPVEPIDRLKARLASRSAEGR